MKTIHLLAILLVLSFGKIYSQSIITVDPNEYGKLKEQNKINPNSQYIIVPPKKALNEDAPVFYSGPSHARADSASCNCLQPLDASYTVANFTNGSAPSYRNDDGSTPIKLLPFNFCFYGTTYTSFFINNNGNITFGSGLTSFSSTGFPTNTAIMVAPFWADVDTRNTASGLVYYKITNNYAIVKWENVGYYSNMADKLNTFQLIISDGTDTILPGNNNVGFCYGDMEWTTGSASNGVNGFGGVPATVGVNNGTGAANGFAQIGRFDQAGTAYDGPYLNNDGVSWLDNQSFFWNVCGSANNLPPQLTSTSGGGAGTGAGAQSCQTDTINLCTNTDTLLLSAGFVGPENGQTITLSLSAPTLGGAANLNTSLIGGVTNGTITVIANPGLVGTHLVTLTATDNGSPNLSSSVTYLINIPNINLPNPILSVNPPAACFGTPVTVSLSNCALYTNILWADSSSGCSVVINGTGSTYVTVTTLTGCSKTSFQNITISPSPTANVTGLLNFCSGAGTNLTGSGIGGTQPIASYNWTGAATGTGSTINITSAGTLTLTVTDANGCTDDTTVTITNNTLTVNIAASNQNFCPGVPVTLTSSVSGSNYTWSGPGGPFGNNQSITVAPLVSSTYSLSITQNGCTATDQITLVPLLAPSVLATAVDSICLGDSITVTAVASPSGTYNYVWSNGATTQSITIPSSLSSSSYTVTASVSGSCPSTTSISIPAAFPIPSASISIPNNQAIICFKGTNTLTANVASGTPGYTYQWSPTIPGTPTTNNTYDINAGGTFQVIVTDLIGCKDTATFQVTEIVPSVSIQSPNLICNGDTALLVANGSSTTPITSYQWTQGSSTISNNDSILVTDNTIYVVTITDQLGCTASAYSSLNYYPNPVANFVSYPISPSLYPQPVTFSNTSTVSFGYNTGFFWNFGDNDSISGVGPHIHNYAAPGTYNVMLITTSNFGCIDTVVIQHEVDVIIPAINIITPNGDAVNNALKFEGLQFFGENTITIFNRWGKKVFEKEGYDNSWTGDGFSDGTYYYILEIPKNKPNDIISGFFQISR